MENDASVTSLEDAAALAGTAKNAAEVAALQNNCIKVDSKALHDMERLREAGYTDEILATQALRDQRRMEEEERERAKEIEEARRRADELAAAEEAAFVAAAVAAAAAAAFLNVQIPQLLGGVVDVVARHLGPGGRDGGGRTFAQDIRAPAERLVKMYAAQAAMTFGYIYSLSCLGTFPLHSSAPFIPM